MSTPTRKQRALAGDFYETPAWATRAILPHLPIMGGALDPCAGKGAIMRVVGARFGVAIVDGMEISAELAKHCPKEGEFHVRDALAPEAWPASGCVIMNPPFSKAMAFVTRALAEQRPHQGTTAALLRLGMMASATRLPFWQKRPADAYVLAGRPSFTKNGKSDSSEYAWFVWGPGRGGRWTVLSAAKPPSKPKKTAIPEAS